MPSLSHRLKKNKLRLIVSRNPFRKRTYQKRKTMATHPTTRPATRSCSSVLPCWDLQTCQPTVRFGKVFKKNNGVSLVCYVMLF